MSILHYLAPTINYGPEQINKLPILYGETDKVEKLVNLNILSARYDWDSYETSWAFVAHPLVRPASTVADAFARWEAECN